MASEQTRLDDALERRRVELRMSWRDVTREAGMSNEGLRAIRRGERRPTAVTKARIEHALRWATGSIDAILAGGEPTPVNDIQRRQPAAYARGFELGQNLDDETLAAILRSIGNQMLVTELARRLNVTKP